MKFIDQFKMTFGSFHSADLTPALFFQTKGPEMLIGCFYKNSIAIWNAELENFGIVRDTSDRPEVGCGHLPYLLTFTVNLTLLTVNKFV